MKFQKFIYLFAVVIAFTACKNENSSNPEIIEVASNEGADLDVSERSGVTFKDNRVTTAFKLYNTVRAALVNTNSEDAAKYADILYRSEIMQEADDNVKEAIKSIMESTDVEDQRKHFMTVSAAIEKLVDGQVESGIVYKQYCPMAFGNTGAYWISDSKEIRNPYFGDKMLKCGRIDAKIE